MTLVRRIALAAAALVICSGVARAQESQPAPPPPAANRDSVDFTGDWDWSAQLRDGTINGAWRLTRNESGRYTGVVMRENANSSPIRSFTVRRRSFTMTVDFDSELYTFQGSLEGTRAVNGTLSFRGGMGRLRAERRGQ